MLQNISNVKTASKISGGLYIFTPFDVRNVWLLSGNKFFYIYITQFYRRHSTFWAYKLLYIWWSQILTQSFFSISKIYYTKFNICTNIYKLNTIKFYHLMEIEKYMLYIMPHLYINIIIIYLPNIYTYPYIHTSLALRYSKTWH